MKISELIEWLSAQQSEFGDIPVCVQNGPEIRARPLTECGVVTYCGIVVADDAKAAPPFVILNHFTRERRF